MHRTAAWRIALYRKQAAKARAQAITASTSADREEFLHVALNWEALASEVASAASVDGEPEGAAYQ